MLVARTIIKLNDCQIQVSLSKISTVHTIHIFIYFSNRGAELSIFG